MADLSDITAYLAQQSANAVYPNGTGQPSVANCDVRIYEGWPLPDALQLDIEGKYLAAPGQPPVARPGGPVANVSIYPMPGATAHVYQVQNRNDIIVTPTPYGINFSIAGDGTITFSGAPKAGEYITLICDRAHVFSQTGTNLAALITALANQALPIYPGTTSSATTLKVPAQFALTVRQGAPGVLGRVTHRQRHSVMVSVWAQNHTVRTQLAAAIDNYIKQTNVAAMPDTSQALFCYSHTNQTDEQELMMVYRRDLIFDCEYATVWQFPGYVITSAEIDITNNFGLQPVIQTAVAPALA